MWLQGARENPATKYYVQIVDSSNDSRVVSDVRDSYQSLLRQNFKAIIGISDVYGADPISRQPRTHADIPRMHSGISAALTKCPIVDYVLAVMEVEAWFLGEHHHLSKIGTG